MGKASVEIHINLPSEQLTTTSKNYVAAALKKIARSFIDNEEDIDRAAIFGNWDYKVKVDHRADYQPMLWESTDE